MKQKCQITAYYVIKQLNHKTCCAVDTGNCNDCKCWIVELCFN